MKKIVIKGVFSGQVNNFIIVDVYNQSSSPTPYNLTKKFRDGFEETIIDLQPNSKYRIDFSGVTSGQFDLSIDGDFEQPNPIHKVRNSGTFDFGVSIKTKI